MGLFYKSICYLLHYWGWDRVVHLLPSFFSPRSINLLGWVSMALAGLIYHQFPMAGSNWKRSFLVIFDRCANTNLLDDLFRLGRLGVDVLMSGVGGPLAMAAVVLFRSMCCTN